MCPLAVRETVSVCDRNGMWKREQAKKIGIACIDKPDYSFFCFPSSLYSECSVTWQINSCFYSIHLCQHMSERLQWITSLHSRQVMKLDVLRRWHRIAEVEYRDGGHWHNLKIWNQFTVQSGTCSLYIYCSVEGKCGFPTLSFCICCCELRLWIFLLTFFIKWGCRYLASPLYALTTKLIGESAS